MALSAGNSKRAAVAVGFEAYGIGQAIEVHRRQKPHCTGTLYWQLNDCWPVASWSSIDYYGNWKALQYEAKRQFAPVILTTAPMQQDLLPIFVVNDSAKNIEAQLQISLCEFDGKIVDSLRVDNLTIPGQSSLEIAQYSLPKKFKIDKLTHHYLLLQLYRPDGQLLAQKIHYYLYPKQLELDAQGIRMSVQRFDAGTQDERYIFTLSAEQFKYGVAISTNLNGRYSDNFFTLLPGEEKQVTFTPASPAKQQMLYSVRAYGK